MTNPLSTTHKKQHKLAAQGNLKLAAIVAAFALAGLKFYPVYVKLLFWVAGFFFAMSALEFVGFKWLKHQNRVESEVIPKEDFLPNDAFELTNDGHSDAYERRFFLQGKPMRVVVPAKLFQRAESNANAVVADPAQLASKFREFRSFAADSNETFADEIKALELQSILFVTTDSAKVFFTEESGGEAWEATWDAKSNKFRAMTLQS